MKQTLTVPMIVALTAVRAIAVAQEPTWNTTLEEISSGVVSIQVDSTRAFDTERNRSSQASGFVVDAERGLILTNRHVVAPGPVVAQAIFLNQEEVDLVPVYRDPVPKPPPRVGTLRIISVASYERARSPTQAGPTPQES